MRGQGGGERSYVDAHAFQLCYLLGDDVFEGPACVGRHAAHLELLRRALGVRAHLVLAVGAIHGVAQYHEQLGPGADGLQARDDHIAVQQVGGGALPREQRGVLEQCVGVEVLLVLLLGRRRDAPASRGLRHPRIQLVQPAPVEEVGLAPLAANDQRMLAQQLIQRGGPALLRADDDEGRHLSRALMSGQVDGPPSLIQLFAWLQDIAVDRMGLHVILTTGWERKGINGSLLITLQIL